jgi:hypothetical protein
VSRVGALDDVSPYAVHLNGLKPGPWRDARAASCTWLYGCQLARTCSLNPRSIRDESPLIASPDPPLFELKVLTGKARQQLWETEGPIPKSMPLEV